MLFVSFIVVERSLKTESVGELSSESEVFKGEQIFIIY